MIELLEKLNEVDFKDQFKSLSDAELDKRFGPEKDWTVYHVVVSGNEHFPYGGVLKSARGRTHILAIMNVFPKEKEEFDEEEVGYEYYTGYYEYFPGVWAEDVEDVTGLNNIAIAVVAEGDKTEAEMAGYALKIWSEDG